MKSYKKKKNPDLLHFFWGGNQFILTKSLFQLWPDFGCKQKKNESQLALLFCWLAIISFSQQLNRQKWKSHSAAAQKSWEEENNGRIPWAKQLKRLVRGVPFRSLAPFCTLQLRFQLQRQRQWQWLGDKAWQTQGTVGKVSVVPGPGR